MNPNSSTPIRGPTRGQACGNYPPASAAQACKEPSASVKNAPDPVNTPIPSPSKSLPRATLLEKALCPALCKSMDKRCQNRVATSPYGVSWFSATIRLRLLITPSASTDSPPSLQESLAEKQPQQPDTSPPSAPYHIWFECMLPPRPGFAVH